MDNESKGAYFSFGVELNSPSRAWLADITKQSFTATKLSNSLGNQGLQPLVTQVPLLDNLTYTIYVSKVTF